jgi:hypothetical protein
MCRGYGSNSNNNYYKYGNYDDDRYSGQDYKQSLAVCDDSVVEVTASPSHAALPTHFTVTVTGILPHATTETRPL